MTINVAINGFGRIGRLIYRSLLESGKDDINITVVNDLATAEGNAHLLKYDTVFGTLEHEVKLSGDVMKVANQETKVFAERDPSKLPWREMGIDIVMDCTGIFNKTKEAAEVHIKSGAKRVLASAPCKGADLTVVYGVNHGKLNSDHLIVSNGSCTTNCLAPVLHVLDSEFGVDHGFMTTVHSYTGDQRTTDTFHKDLRRARAGAQNIVPTSTGAARAIGLVLPNMDGKLDGAAVRVPTVDVSMIDLAVVLKKEVSADDINSAFIKASGDSLRGILGYVDEPLVSSDFIGDERSSIIDTLETKVMQGNFARIVSWYDNEWGFSNRMLDTAREMAKHL
jgi:glyceraldehyde 3-phosphate dehydrogenase